MVTPPADRRMSPPPLSPPPPRVERDPIVTALERRVQELTAKLDRITAEAAAATKNDRIRVLQRQVEQQANKALLHHGHEANARAASPTRAEDTTRTTSRKPDPARSMVFTFTSTAKASTTHTSGLLIRVFIFFSAEVRRQPGAGPRPKWAP